MRLKVPGYKEKEYIPKEGDYFNAILLAGPRKGKYAFGSPCKATKIIGCSRYPVSVTAIDTTFDDNGEHTKRTFATSGWSFEPSNKVAFDRESERKKGKN